MKKQTQTKKKTQTKKPTLHYVKLHLGFSLSKEGEDIDDYRMMPAEGSTIDELGFDYILTIQIPVKKHSVHKETFTLK